ncbi:efflux RND transporter periplasmic adaptor subunit [Hymenobacter nivis]|uniref:Efflux RND transporter periplasmic adaptor subunit n=1 Tax=Hymenobacter nivis TaxID=1850093 RepID=A0A2Z3GJP1_9BACT|nr:efflux RND transporter periplasmic adaptor subunit [Hymenobacter nivis]AWM32511.1 efflux RND transporter periplasmic adaptor subunit [Hymenobacter nivis]
MPFPAPLLRALAALGLAATAALFGGCNSTDAAQGQAAAEATAAPAPADVRYDAVRVTATQPAQSLSLPGELDSYFQTDIMPRVSSYVKALHADIGDHVRRDQVLAELDAPELTAALSEARSKQSVTQASFQASRGTYRRLRQTARTAGAVSPLSLDQARTQATSDSLNVVAARAHYQAAAQMAAYLRLTAPMAGVITERNAAPGALVGPGGQSTVPLFRLKQLSRLRLRVAVPEAYVGDIHQGAPVQFNVRTFPGRTFAGSIDRVADNVTPGTRAETVEIDIPNPQEQLKPGMFASATIPIKSPKTSLYVPKSAVVSTAERTYVIRVVAGKTELVDVQKGDENAGQVQVFGPLKAGDVVLKAGNEEIVAQQPVQVALVGR